MHNMDVWGERNHEIEVLGIAKLGLRLRDRGEIGRKGGLLHNT